MIPVCGTVNPPPKQRSRGGREFRHGTDNEAGRNLVYIEVYKDANKHGKQTTAVQQVRSERRTFVVTTVTVEEILTFNYLHRSQSLSRVANNPMCLGMRQLRRLRFFLL